MAGRKTFISLNFGSRHTRVLGLVKLPASKSAFAAAVGPQLCADELQRRGTHILSVAHTVRTIYQLSPAV